MWLWNVTAFNWGVWFGWFSVQSSGRKKKFNSFSMQILQILPCRVHVLYRTKRCQLETNTVLLPHKHCFFLLKNKTKTQLCLIAAKKQVTCVISSLPDSTCMRKHVADNSAEMKSHLLSALIVETSCQFLVCCSPFQTRCLYFPLRCSFFCPKLAPPYTGAVQR